MITPVKNTQVYVKIDAGEDQNQWVRYASEISGNDLDFLATLEGENGLWTQDRRSIQIGSNGYYDYGFCMFNEGFHPKVVHDPKFLTDGKWQLDRCWEAYKSGTTFYAYFTRQKHYDKFVLTQP